MVNYCHRCLIFYCVLLVVVKFRGLTISVPVVVLWLHVVVFDGGGGGGSRGPRPRAVTDALSALLARSAGSLTGLRPAGGARATKAATQSHGRARRALRRCSLLANCTARYLSTLEISLRSAAAAARGDAVTEVGWSPPSSTRLFWNLVEKQLTLTLTFDSSTP